MVAFDIGDWCCDKLRVNGIDYYGDDSIPDSVVVQGTISWITETWMPIFSCAAFRRSPKVPKVSSSLRTRGTGWKICLGEAPVQVQWA